MFANTSLKQQGKIAGWLYLIIAVLGIFSIAYVPSVIVSTKATETLQNLQNHSGLFRIGVFADVLICLIEIVLSTLLYQMFRNVNKTAALIATYARIAMVMVMAVNLLVYITPLFLIENPALSKLFTTAELARNTQLAMDIHANGIIIWGFFFGLHLTLLSLLAIKSPKHPTIISYIMLAGSIGYSLESFNQACLGNNAILGIISGVLLAAVVIGEVGFAVWLMIYGEKDV